MPPIPIRFPKLSELGLELKGGGPHGFYFKRIAQQKPESRAQAVSEAIINPAEQVADDFSIDLQSAESESMVPQVPTPDFSPSPIPRPQLTAGQIPGMFGPLVSQLEGQQGPVGRPVPSEFTPEQTFLSTFAGILGTQLAQNPAILEDIQRRMADRETRRRAIADQNYANDLLFSQEKANRLLALRGQILEEQIQTALSQGDKESARVAAENLEKLRGKHEAYVASIKEQGEDRRAALRARTGGAETKPLSMNDYLTQIRELATADPKKLPEYAQRLFGRSPSSKEDAIIQVHAGAAFGGDTEAVQGLGRRRLIESLKTKYKIGERINQKQAERLVRGLMSIGFGPQDISQVAREFGFSVE